MSCKCKCNCDPCWICGQLPKSVTLNVGGELSGFNDEYVCDPPGTVFPISTNNDYWGGPRHTKPFHTIGAITPIDKEERLLDRASSATPAEAFRDIEHLACQHIWPVDFQVNRHSGGEPPRPPFLDIASAIPRQEIASSSFRSDAGEFDYYQRIYGYLGISLQVGDRDPGLWGGSAEAWILGGYSAHAFAIPSLAFPSTLVSDIDFDYNPFYAAETGSHRLIAKVCMFYYHEARQVFDPNPFLYPEGFDTGWGSTNYLAVRTETVGIDLPSPCRNLKGQSFTVGGSLYKLYYTDWVDLPNQNGSGLVLFDDGMWRVAPYWPSNEVGDFWNIVGPPDPDVPVLRAPSMTDTVKLFDVEINF